MFLFNKKTPDYLKLEYKPNLEYLMSSHLKSNIKSITTPNIENKNKNHIKWARIEFEKSRNYDSDYFFLPYEETLVSSLLKDRRKKKDENQLILFFNYFSEWLDKQIRSTGFLNWFHPWIAIRHRYFYRGY
jgi:hypothetical protein